MRCVEVLRRNVREQVMHEVIAIVARKEE